MHSDWLALGGRRFEFSWVFRAGLKAGLGAYNKTTPQENNYLQNLNIQLQGFMVRMGVAV